MHEHAQRHSACSWRAQQHHVEVFLAPVQSKRMQINKKGGDKACITLTRVSKKHREMQSWQSRLKQNHLRRGMGKEKEALSSQAVGGKALGDWGWTWLQHISKLLNHWSGLKSQWQQGAVGLEAKSGRRDCSNHSHHIHSTGWACRDWDSSTCELWEQLQEGTWHCRL